MIEILLVQNVAVIRQTESEYLRCSTSLVRNPIVLRYLFILPEAESAEAYLLYYIPLMVY